MAIESQRLMSKTQHYRKVTKPLLERKRRARMNHYLDELKDLIVETMEAQGEHVTKLEKADILEMTVQYLKSKKQVDHMPVESKINPEKFRAGYTQAAYEVSKVFASFPGIDVQFGTQLMKHLGYQPKDKNRQEVLTLTSSENGLCSQIHFSDVEFKNVPSPKIHFPKGEEPEGEEVWRPW